MDFSVDGEIAETRAIHASGDEVRLESALIFFYRNDSGEPAAYRYVTVPAGRRTISFDPPAGLEEGNDYDILAIGNPDNYLESGMSVESYAASLAALTYDEAKIETMLSRTQPIVKGLPGVLPMHGQFVDAVSMKPRTFNYHKSPTGIAVEGQFYFSRAVSRVDLSNLVPKTLMIESVKVANYRTEGYPHMDGYRGEHVIDINRIPDEAWAKMASPTDENSGQKLTASLYCFPNIVSASDPGDKETICLIIKGRYCEGCASFRSRKSEIICSTIWGIPNPRCLQNYELVYNNLSTYNRIEYQ